MDSAFVATAPIKLVIWDMDDTFWTGTLSEGDIELIDSNIAIVKTLADRGIMSSISSKNDLAPVKKVLEDAGVWDYFIFPQVSWNSKSGAVNNIIEQANLRPDNVLFIDDNSINVEEIRFRFPTIMAAYPWDVLPLLLDLEHARGKDDTAHSRLKQYKQLEKKVADQSQATISNEDFLRQCDIKLRFDYDVEQHFDRIIELINRSNQLNFTKVRIESPQAIAEFKEQLNRFDIVSAAIFASDRYGNHGLIGFFMQQKNERSNTLQHFVWSCRMMNAGLEQYVYERLGKPEIKVVEPVSNPITVFSKIDWIKESLDGEEDSVAGDAPSLLLIGSCDLTAVASYCSPNRVEFVNGVKNGIMTRYDDFGFILGDHEKVPASRELTKVPCWDKADFQAFHSGLASSNILIVSLSAAMKGAYLVTDDDVAVRVHPEGLGIYVDDNPFAGFLRGSRFFALNDQQRDDMLSRALSLMEASATSATFKFLLGANTRDIGGAMSEENYRLAKRYNEVCLEFCRVHPGWHFVSIDDVVSADKLVDDRHYTRIGYFDIAMHINETVRLSEPSDEPRHRRPVSSDVVNLIRAGRSLSRFHLFGAKQGPLQQVRRAIKLMPLSGPLRRVLAKRKKDSLVA